MKVTQAFMFEAAHRLPYVPDGHKCKNMHGHSYRVELTFEGPVDPKTGFVVDFFDIEKAVHPLLSRVDHHVLNEVNGLENPTAEHICLWFLYELYFSFQNLTVVRIYETPMCWAEATREP
jgi:6-pyruvoyltetrahydropterin/6-carboxytetrahydropterin synthase